MFTQTRKKMKILVDSGHGADTPGKRSPDGLFREYQFNRNIARLVVDGLRTSGIDAEMLVTEENDISLKERVARVNRICADLGKENVILVSVHANAAGDGGSWMSAHGWSCFTSKGRTAADDVAECMYDAFEEEFPDMTFRKDYSDGDRDWEENFYLLQRSKCPAVLLENFFYDNRTECLWLMRGDIQARIVSATIKGVQCYLTDYE